MTEPMNDERLVEIRAREAAATRGPWDTFAHVHGAHGCRCLSCYDEPTGFLVDHPNTMDCSERVLDRPNDFGKPRTACDEGPLLSYEDADFAAHARTDIPELLGEVDRLRDEVQRYRSFCGEALCGDVERDRDRLEAQVEQLHADRVSRGLEDRHIDRVLAMLVLRHGGRVEFSAVEMEAAPAHGEFVCFEELTTKAMVLAFQAREEAL